MVHSELCKAGHIGTSFFFMSMEKKKSLYETACFRDLLYVCPCLTSLFEYGILQDHHTQIFVPILPFLSLGILARSFYL